MKTVILQWFSSLHKRERMWQHLMAGRKCCQTGFQAWCIENAVTRGFSYDFYNEKAEDWDE
jgi:hypothetical protein